MIRFEMKRIGKILITATILVMVSACKKTYNPTVVAAANNYLVVEGVINVGADSTIITLSRTVNLDSKVSSVKETGAKISVVSSDNTTYNLTAGANGIYYSPGLNLDYTKKYRLNITTKDNKQYVSDYVQAQITPPIDSVNFKIVNDQLQFYVNSHDAANNTRYYRFDYQETWQFHAKYQSRYYSDGTRLRLRTLPTDDVYNCWGNHQSNTIVIGSTAALTKDILSNVPVTYITSNDEKLETKYSILVREYALSKEGYTFWTNLKKNTESLGSIFDAQPSVIPGNIHCISNPPEPVLGYISASTVTSKRIFVDNAVLPPSWVAKYPYTCQADSILNAGLSVFNIKPVAEIAINQLYAQGSDAIIGYSGSSRECADCTIRGVNKKPLFWP